MTMSEGIEKFAEQLKYDSPIINGPLAADRNKFLVAGMGGSNHATDLLKAWRPSLDIITHRNYGLPENIEADRLVIACSHSGNTEETVDAYKQARQKNLKLAVIATGGQLLDLAKADGVPYIQIPKEGLQPRSAGGYMFVALLKLMGDEADLAEVRVFAKKFKPAKLKAAAKKLATKLRKKIPIIYASPANYALANNWKIKFNESSKVPSYVQLFPELNHNEINGFFTDGGRHLVAKKFCFVMFKDMADDQRLQKRLTVTASLYREMNYEVVEIELTDDDKLTKIFSTLILGDWTSWFLAKYYKIDPETVVLVEKFKEQLTK